MSEAFYRYSIRSGWKGRVETPASIGAKLIKTLDALTGIDPIFAGWQLTNTRNVSSISLAAARSGIARLIEDNVVRDSFDEPNPLRGYHAYASAGKFKHPRSVSFNVLAGGKSACDANLEFGEYDTPQDLAIVTFPLFKAALLAINAIWLAPWACAQAFRSGTVMVPIDFLGTQAFRVDGVPQVPSDPTFPYSIFHIPWFAYLSAPLAAGLKLTPEIQTERTHDGGLLMIAAEERLDPTNPAHVRRARIIAETMIACTGWQPRGTKRG